MKRSRLNPISKKRKGISKQVMTALKERSEGICERWYSFENGFGVRCKRYGKHPHHILPKSQGGEDELGNLAWVCPTCHRWIHDHPIAAIEDGILIPYDGYKSEDFLDYKTSKGIK